LFNASPAKIVGIVFHTAMTLPRSLKWMAGVLLTLIALIILVVAFFDWNWLRDPMASSGLSAPLRDVPRSIRLSLTWPNWRSRFALPAF
jgi:hypothetical protein